MSKRLLILPLLALLLLSSLLYLPVSAQGWLSGWKYRKAIYITNNGDPLYNYQILVTVDTSFLVWSEKLRSDAGDLRFTDSNGTLLPYYIESGINTASTKIWVKVPYIPSGQLILFMYYGNPSATSLSDPNSVFDLYDNFTTFNSSKWKVHSESCIVYANGTLDMYCDGEFAGVSLISRSSLPSNSSYVLTARMMSTVESDDAYAYNAAVGFASNMTYNIFSVPYYKCDASLMHRSDSDLRLEDYGKAVYAQNGSYMPNTWYTVSLYYIKGKKLKAVFYRETKEIFASSENQITLVLDKPSCPPNYVWLGHAPYPSGLPSHAYFDYIYVRKYASPEPSVSISPFEEQTQTLPSAPNTSIGFAPAFSIPIYVIFAVILFIVIVLPLLTEKKSEVPWLK